MLSLYHLLSVVPRQPSRLGLSVKLPATANTAQSLDQADPTAPTSASLLRFLGKPSWRWEVGAGKLPVKKSGCNALYLIEGVIQEPRDHIPMSDFALPNSSL